MTKPIDAPGPELTPREVDDRAARYPWATYLGGKWTKDRPARPGIYATATREGAIVGYRLLVEQVGGKVRDTTASPGDPWMGWWWSVALPLPPRVPPRWAKDQPTAAELGEERHGRALGKLPRAEVREQEEDQELPDLAATGEDGAEA